MHERAHLVLSGWTRRPLALCIALVAVTAAWVSPSRALATTEAVTVSHPIAGDDFATGSDVFAEGVAADPAGVLRVNIAIKDNLTGEWVAPNDVEQATRYWFGPALLTPSGGSGVIATDWYDNAAGSVILPPGSYGVVAQEIDIGHITVTSGTPLRFDVGPPESDLDVSITSPGSGHAFGDGTLVAFAGTAASSIGVSDVRYAIKDLTTGEWESPSGEQPSQYWAPAVDGCSGGCTPDDWSVTSGSAFVDLPSGSYKVQAQVESIDAQFTTSALLPFSVG